MILLGAVPHDTLGGKLFLVKSQNLSFYTPSASRYWFCKATQAVWSMFGDNVALCAGDLLLSSAYAALVDVTDVAAMPRLVTQTHAAVVQTIRGEASHALPPHADFHRLAAYQAMAAAKSGPLLRLPFGLVFSYCNRPDLVAT